MLAPLLVAGPAAGAATVRAQGTPAWERDIAPLLERSCVECHGAHKVKGGLRLDSYAALVAGGGLGTRPVVEPGSAQQSALLARVATDDELERMPADREPLPAAQIELLRAWIEAGAPGPADEAAGQGELARHWAYEAPRAVEPPSDPSGWATSAIDRFTLQRMTEHGLSPSPRADRATLARRLSLALTGLPPTLDELEHFLADESADAYEREVERLLDSPHYGEHMARAWLDLARYADSHGYEKDARRTMWRYRDWVIEAFASDMPFDRFTVEQLAGDLLPEPTLEQLVATGFHRNTMVNEEGGIDPEEFRVAAVVDRVNTTAEVWLGSTLACAQCHDHKFDPFRQEEYFRFFAFFDSTEDTGNSPEPRIEAPTRAQQSRRPELLTREQGLVAQLETWSDALQQEFDAWAGPRRAALVPWSVLRPASARSDEGRLAVLDDGSALALGEVPQRATYTLVLPWPAGAGPLAALRIEVLTDESLPEGGPGRTSHRNFVLSELSLEADGAPVALESALADHEQHTGGDWPAADAIDGDPATGWAIAQGEGEGHQLVVRLATPTQARELRVRLDQEFGGGHVIGRVRVAGAEAAPPLDAQLVAPWVEALLVRTPDDWTQDERERVESWFRARAEGLDAARAELARVRAELAAPTALVMREREEPRETRVHRRGSFLDPGERVEPGVPRIFGELRRDAGEGDAERRATRLDLARWLVSSEHPLVARVTANRVWRRLFGEGLVRTQEDFGTQADPPSHPELLDWLALELEREGWSLKALVRTLVLSRTFQQASALSPEALRLDPGNTWLARGPRVRLAAEEVRDVALAASGLLAREIGGPSVFPPQPLGTWAMTYNAERWMTSAGADRFRRGMYTFWRRTAPYPTFGLFDAPSRELACSRRPRTNTPLQALALLNDPVFVECSAALAWHMLQAEGDDAQRVRDGFRRCTSREPEPREVTRLLALLEAERDALHEASNDAALLEELRAVFEHLGANLESAPELTLWMRVASVLLNLDETVTRG